WQRRRMRIAAACPLHRLPEQTCFVACTPRFRLTGIKVITNYYKFIYLIAFVSIIENVCIFIITD
ncbi:hypothetical protein, partial [Undibacterium luofuense]|uniref:hypothetical protein n=1 Tax=Undibacterium luofuense TaxID=2828733 RepID=UPI0030EF260D